jgi:hypothetical protein
MDYAIAPGMRRLLIGRGCDATPRNLLHDFEENSACKAGVIATEETWQNLPGDPNGIRTRVHGLKGRCPNHWTMGSRGRKSLRAQRRQYAAGEPLGKRKSRRSRSRETAIA